MTTLTERELTRLLGANPDIAVAGGYQKVVEAVFKPATRSNPEHSMQVAIIAECERKGALNPLWRLVYAIPNGGHRSKAVAGKLKAEGVRKGILDLCLPIARHGFHGLYMELKISPNKPTVEQLAWIDALTVQGYFVTVVYDDPAEAIRILEWYLEAKE